MDDRVYRYIRAVRDTCNHPVNTDIVVIETDDFVPTLTPEQLERAIIEVEIMGWSDSWPDFEARQRILTQLFALHDRIDDVEGGIDASLEQAELSAAAAATSSESSASSASAAAASASAAEDSAEAAQGTASAVGASLARGVRAALRATNIGPLMITNGAGARTLVPWPAGALRGAPFTRRPSSWSISGGVLHVDEPGVYNFTLSGIFTTGLLTAGAFRFYVAVGHDLAGATPDILDEVPFVSQVAVLTVPTGLAGCGQIVIPDGGAELALFAGHTAALPVALTMPSLDHGLVLADLDYDQA
jgi:hypothetical protein